MKIGCSTISVKDPEGDAQRAAIARAVINRPGLIFADEHAFKLWNNM